MNNTRKVTLRNRAGHTHTHTPSPLFEQFLLLVLSPQSRSANSLEKFCFRSSVVPCFWKRVNKQLLYFVKSTCHKVLRRWLGIRYGWSFYWPTNPRNATNSPWLTEEDKKRWTVSLKEMLFRSFQVTSNELQWVNSCELPAWSHRSRPVGSPCGIC